MESQGRSLVESNQQQVSELISSFELPAVSQLRHSVKIPFLTVLQERKVDLNVGVSPCLSPQFHVFFLKVLKLFPAAEGSVMGACSRLL